MFLNNVGMKPKRENCPEGRKFQLDGPVYSNARPPYRPIW